MGLLINLEAIDRSGKTTQARLIVEALRARGFSVAHRNFPDRPARGADPANLAQASTGVLISRVLSEEKPLALFEERDTLFRRTSLGNLDPEERTEIARIIEEKLFQVLQSVNRREGTFGPGGLLELLASHDVVVVERMLSSRAYGVAMGVSQVQINAIEGELPKPDLTFLLDVDPAVARARRSEDALDKYEANSGLQGRVRALYGEMVRDDAEAAFRDGRAASFRNIDASRPIEEITDEILGHILRLTGPGSVTVSA